MIRRKLLVVTSDPKIVRQVGEAAGPAFSVGHAMPHQLDAHLRADGGLEVLIVDHAPTAAVADAVRLLEHAKERRPNVRRGLLTGYGDIGEIVRAVHNDSAEFVLQRPVVAAELLGALARLPRPDAAVDLGSAGAAA